MISSDSIKKLHQLIDRPHGAYLCPISDLGLVADQWSEWLKLWLCTEPVNYEACQSCRSCLLLRDNSHPDLNFPQAEAIGGVEDIREGIDFIMKSPVFSRRRIWVLPNADQMNRAAMNALLKILEEPPTCGILLLYASRPNYLLPTIRSRCLFLSEWSTEDSGVARIQKKKSISFLLAEEAHGVSRGNFDEAIRWIDEGKTSHLSQLWSSILSGDDWMNVSEISKSITTDELLAGLQFCCYQSLKGGRDPISAFCYALYDFCTRMVERSFMGITWNEASFREQIFLSINRLRLDYLNP